MMTFGFAFFALGVSDAIAWPPPRNRRATVAREAILRADEARRAFFPLEGASYGPAAGAEEWCLCSANKDLVLIEDLLKWQKESCMKLLHDS